MEVLEKQERSLNEIDEMKAINISHPKLNTIAKSPYIEHGWKMPEGFRDNRYKNPNHAHKAIYLLLFNKKDTNMFLIVK